MSTNALPQDAAEVTNIVDQLERVFEGDAWHGPSLSEILADIPAEQACAHPIPEAHSIWEIVRHTTAWQRAVRERLQGQPLDCLPDDQDWPATDDTSETAWCETVRELRAEYDLVSQEARAWSGRELAETIGGQRFTAYQMLHGVIQHIVYHAGQIAILKKARSETSR